MSRRTSRNNTYYGLGINPRAIYRATVVSVNGSLINIKIPRVGLDNVYENVPIVGPTPSVSDNVFVGFIDMLKAYIPMFMIFSMYSSDSLFLASLAGGGAILGHIFPFFMNFNGGKGMSCYFGMLMGFDFLFGVTFLVSLTSVKSNPKYISLPLFHKSEGVTS